MWKILLYLALCFSNGSTKITYEKVQDIVYQIVGIFNDENATQALAFKQSMGATQLDMRKLEPTVIQPSRTDSYSVWRELCKNKSVRPIAILGPQTAISDGAIRHQCAIAQIPHIQAAWQPFDPDLGLHQPPVEEPIEQTTNEGETENEARKEEAIYRNITINFYPQADEISSAYAKLLKYYRWESFSALYEDDFGLLRIQKILAEHTDQHPVLVRRLNPEIDNNNIFKELKQYQERRILIDCHVDRIHRYIDAANKSHMVNHYQQYILANIDASVVAEKLSIFESNFTWLSLVEHQSLQDAKHFLAPRVDKWTLTGGDIPVINFQVDSLIMDDIANHVLTAVRSLEKDKGLKFVPKPRTAVCDNEGIPWRFGAEMQQALLKAKRLGVTGNVQFDDNGSRFNYTLFINEIYMHELEPLGRWESLNPDNIIIDPPTNEKSSSQKTKKKFIIISRKAKPYFYDREECLHEECADNDRYEGFSVDLVAAIFDELKKENFSYTYEFVYKEENKGYGILDPITKKWNGLIGDLLDGNADFAVCDLTITEERKKVVDFSVPFMSLGISILFTKEQKVVPEMFSFMNPYSFEVWMYTATAYCVVSIVLFVCARISPADWENPQPCDKDPEELENIWNFKNCTWLTMGSIMTQGCDILPKAFGTRWVCGMWWFFAVIVCQTYIAQLAASMTSAMENEPIHSIEDLANQNKILYGSIYGGSTWNFFKSSNDKIYKTIFENMDKNPAVYVETNDEGERRVLNSKNKYAFFMESSSIDYKLRRNCQLQKVGGELDSKDYGIAMPSNSPFRSHMNRAILKLKENTILDKIKKKWWEEMYGAENKTCPDETDEVEGDLEMEHLIGAFLVLIMGLVFAVFITAAEFMNEVRNIVVQEQVTHKEAFVKELKASLNLFQLQKPVQRNPSRAPSLVPSELTKDDKLARRTLAIENFMDFEKQPTFIT